MKKLFLILFVLFSYSAFAQKMPSDYFDEASQLFETKDYDKALIAYQYIVDNYQKNDLYPRAFYNIGYIYFIQKDYSNAILIFKKILESNFKENENLGGSIMGDPYTNYKHRSSILLSNIYYDKQMYDSSLFYFSLSDTVYQDINFCGNEIASNHIYTALRYSDIYQKLNQPEKAIEMLLPVVFITLEDNSEVIEELEKLFIGKINLKKDLDYALSNLYSKKIKMKDFTYMSYYMKFLNIDIYIPNIWYSKEDKFDKNKIVEEIKQSEFYIMVNKL